jgi:hypothetical protein
MTPLHYAAAAGNGADVLALLLQYFPDACGTPERESGRGQWPLHLAAASRVAPVAALELLVGTFPDALVFEDLDGCTPIVLAARRGLSAAGLAYLYSAAAMRQGVTSSDKAALLHDAIASGASIQQLTAIMDLVPDAPLLKNNSGDVPIFTGENNCVIM